MATKKPAKKPAKKPVKKTAAERKKPAKKVAEEVKEAAPAPRKYRPSKYRTEMCDQLISMMKTGDSKTHFCAEHYISDKTFDSWMQKHEEFKEAYAVALRHSEKWWQNIAKKHIIHANNGTILNSVAWSMNMRNRFRWTEHRVLKVEGLKEAPTLGKKFEVVMHKIENGCLTPSEISCLNDTLSVGLKIVEAMELLGRIEKLEALLAEKEDEKKRK